jgi:hypothetical protein
MVQTKKKLMKAVDSIDKATGIEEAVYMAAQSLLSCVKKSAN